MKTVRNKVIEGHIASTPTSLPTFLTAKIPPVDPQLDHLGLGIEFVSSAGRTGARVHCCMLQLDVGGAKVGVDQG